MSGIICRLPEAIALLPTPNRRIIKRVRRIELIILHATGKGGFRSAVDWLRKAKRQNRTSAHYVVDRDGSVIALAEDNDITWHAGYGRWSGRGAINTRSVGIELVNDNDGRESYNESQLEACLFICYRIAQTHGLRAEHVIGHADVDPNRKTDPAGFPWTRFRASLVNNLGGPQGGRK